MSQYVEAPTRSFVAGAAIAKHIRVKLSGGKLAAAGVADDWIGTMAEASFADGDLRAVRLRTAQGTRPMVAASAFSAGARVYAAASGKIDDTVTTELVGIALEAATADGDIVEVLPLQNGQAYRIARGEVALDGSNPTPVATGLNSVVAVVLALAGATAPGDNTSVLTYEISGATVNIYAWKNTSGTDPTLVASTGTENVSWIAIGT